MQIKLLPEQKLAKFLCKGLASKHFQLSGHNVSVMHSLRCEHQAATDNTQTNGHARVPIGLLKNIKTGSWPDLVQGPYFADSRFRIALLKLQCAHISP